MAEPPLRVWVLSDGQAGHYNQSRGIVCALQTLRPVEVAWIEIRLRAGLMRTLLRRRLNRSPRPGGLKLLKLCCRIPALPAQACDVIVSAGGKTSFVNAWLAAVLEVPNIYAGSLRGLSPDLFSAVLTLEPVPAASNNLVLQLPPSPIDAASVEIAGAQLRARLGSPQQRYWTLLLGGDGAGYHYRQRDWQVLLQTMQVLADHYGIRWLIASSRRTGRTVERLLKNGLPHGSVALQCWYGEVFPAEAFLGAAQRVFVTEDSMTMLTEAIHAQRPVYSLRPQQAQPDARFQHALQRFVERGWLCRHTLTELARHPELLEQQQCRVLRGEPLTALGERLRNQLGFT